MDFNSLIFVWILIAIIIFCVLFFISAPYGRHIRSGWGKEISAKVGWIFMESPCLYIVFILGFLYRNELDLVHQVFLFIWFLHYIHRTLIYPFFANVKGKKMPLSIALSAFAFNHVNAFVQTIGIYTFTNYADNWLSSLTFICGLMIFLIGMIINIFSDYYIIYLRKIKGPGYHMPSKFLYKYVSSPNYFGEIIEWIGWAILTWSISGIVFALWTIANLFPRAIANHKWYKENFKEYPKNRRAIIPYVI